jgi:ketosteroid isomerase-like protein
MHKTKQTPTALFAAIVGVCLFGTGLAEDSQRSQVANVVKSFNASVTNRDTDAMVSHFAAGGVQFTLRPSHAGLAPADLTSELVAHWSLIAPVVFAATSAYIRQAEILDENVQGDVATVWARISTESTRAGEEKSRAESFTEFYLLVSTPDGWKIAGMVDNRPPDDIGIVSEADE